MSGTKQLEFVTPKPINKKQLPKLLKFTTFEEEEVLKLSKTDINSNLTKIFIEYSNQNKRITLREFKQIFNNNENCELLYLIAVHGSENAQSNSGLNLTEWIDFSKNLLFLNSDYDLNYKQLKIASVKNIELENDDEYKFVFKLFKILENRLIDLNINSDENFISFHNFMSLVKLFDPNNYTKIESYLLHQQHASILNYQSFIKIIQDLSVINFQYEFKKSEGQTISVDKFKHILENFVFKDQIPDEILNKIDDVIPFFSRFSTSKELNYQQCTTLIKFLQDLPKFNYLLLNNIYQTGTTANNLISVDQFYRYVNDYNNLFPNLQNLTSLEEIDLYFYWNSIILQDHLLNCKTSRDVINKLEVLTLLTDFDFESTTKILDQNQLPKTKSLSSQIYQSMYSFFLGSIAGAFGATMVYPIDLIKTRMQLQRSVKLYNGYLDCFLKIFKLEGAKGFYRGIIPQWIGVAPEKLIKLTVNDLVRKFGAKADGNVPVPWEILAGCSAGAAQVIFTNPLEIVKIRLQVQGESQVHNSLFQIINKLGFRGLYKGASLCLLRDVPFSAIYFPTYANLKKHLFNYDPTDPAKVQHLSAVQLLISGALAGVPALYFTTPFDVLKTRLQVETKQHETRYLGIRHCATTILKEEGFRAFFKGGLARVMRSSPQFGFTLLSYEFLQRCFPLETIFDSNIKDDSSIAVINPTKISKMTGNTEFTKLNKFNYYGIGNNALNATHFLNPDVKDYHYGLENLLQYRMLKNFDKINKICSEFSLKFDRIDYMKFIGNSST